MSSNVYAVSFDAHDAQTAASFWAAVLDLITSDFDAEIDRPPGPPPPS